MSGKPIRPEDVAKGKTDHIPAVVFDSFNAEIVASFVNGAAKVIQERVVNRLVLAGMKRSEIFTNGLLNVEEAYENVGWKVTYEKPGYNETGEAYFIFRKPRNSSRPPG